jgi:hypothetical protein
MTTIINSPLKSDFGFSSPNFSVDVLGNVIVRSITQTEDNVVDTDIDFAVSDAGSNAFFIPPATIPNPPINLFRSSSYTFELNLSTQIFNIYLEDKSTLYSLGLKHSDGSIGNQALSKQTGKLTFLVSTTAPDILYYGNQSSGAFGLISIGDAIGRFSTVNITDDAVSSSPTTGALIVAGGLGVSGDVNTSGTLSATELVSSSLQSLSTLTLTSESNIIITIDNVETGTIGVLGSTLPIVDTAINNTVIGNVTPSTATFISASITELPTTNNNITNKVYVDSTATALAIAFGL